MSRVSTVGHSDRSRREFLDLLDAHGVEHLVDVRRFPGSRRHPHFGRERLRRALAEAGIEYGHEEALGGRRGEPAPDSPNAGWRTGGFRAFADHMATAEALEALARVERAAGRRATAMMCAEAVPWRCHRQIIADFLVARGTPVDHVLGPDRVEAHELRAMARVREDGIVVYPPSGTEQTELFGEG